jgi:hypothetical protein
MVGEPERKRARGNAAADYDEGSQAGVDQDPGDDQCAGGGDDIAMCGDISSPTFAILIGVRWATDTARVGRVRIAGEPRQRYRVNPRSMQTKYQPKRGRPSDHSAADGRTDDRTKT